MRKVQIPEGFDSSTQLPSGHRMNVPVILTNLEMCSKPLLPMVGERGRKSR